MPRLFLLLIGVGWLVASPTGLHAQVIFDTNELEDPLLPHPLDAKDLARAKFEAYRADSKRLAREKLAAARISNEERFQQLLDGRATIPWLLASAQRVLEAELALYTDRPDQLAALERHWVQTHDIEEIIRDLYEKGRVSAKELAECTAARCDAEMRWALARAGQAAGATGTVPPSREEANPLNRKDLARAKVAAYQADPEELARNRIAALQTAYTLRLRQFVAGRGNPTATRTDLAQLTEMELARAKNGAKRVAILQTLWAQAWLIEYIDKLQYDEGRISIQEYAAAHLFRLDAEIRWAEAKDQHPKAEQAPAPQHFLFPSLDEDTNPFADDLRDFWIELCKARANAPNHDFRAMRRALYESALAAYLTEARPSPRCRVVLLQDKVASLLDADLGLCEGNACRIAALERSWARYWQIEESNAPQYQAGRIAVRDYMNARYDRLDTRIRLQRALSTRLR